MFAIMENRKRPRLELINTNNNHANETLQGVASTTTQQQQQMGTATLATIGGQSFILSNSSSNALPANILLSICDDNSDESEEYILDHSLLTQIKQEQSVATQTNSQQATLLTSMPQFRIVSQPAGKTLNNSVSLNSSPTLTNNNSGTISSSGTSNSSSSSLITNSVHLPPGCEIYVIKEVIDTPKQIIAESSPNNNSITTTTSPKTLMANNQTTIKLEPMSPLPLVRQGPTNTNQQNLILTNNTNNNNSAPATSNLTPSSNVDDTAKRSLILEAYKKRDDKRRATHNEVERRRRDKINSWIFKLKEMLPSDITPANKDNLLAINQNTNANTATRLLVQPAGCTASANANTTTTATTTRTPPSDSKSQILIKACEYIKTMQEEIQSLRECLTENENLRLSNQRLQEEINNLRTKQKLQLNNNNILLTTAAAATTNTTNNSNNNNNNHNSDNTDDCELTLNSLNTTYANVQLFAPSGITTNQNHHHHHNLAGLVGLTTNSNGGNTTSSSNGVNVTYAKRELIITDYVD